MTLFLVGFLISSVVAMSSVKSPAEEVKSTHEAASPVESDVEKTLLALDPTQV